MSNTAWNDQNNSGNDITYTPYSNDQNTSEFSDNEKYLIWLAWLEASEDFGSFDINITTSQAVYDSTPKSERSQLIATTTDSFYGSAGGVAFVNVFNRNSDYYKTGFVWNSSANSMGMTHSHEAGHQMGLRHDGNSTSEYDSGHGVWGPIMGAPFGKLYVQWSKGEYSDANNYEDDLEILESVLGVVSDDSGETLNDPNIIPFPSEQVTGHISPQGLGGTNDVDVYSFELLEGADISVNVKTILALNNENRASNLSLSVNLKTGDGAILANTKLGDINLLSPQTNMFNFQGFLPADTYYIEIDGVSPDSNWTTGFDEYGNEGGYSISVLPLSTYTITTSIQELSGLKGDKFFDYLFVPLEAEDIRISILGGTGDADLYVRFNENVSVDNYDCAPFLSGNDEVCEDNRNNGTYHILLNSFADYSDVSLVKSFKIPANIDSDGDGLTNGQEINLGTDYLNADSDNDGLSDGHEVEVLGTDPLNHDTDGDGTPDAQDNEPLNKFIGGLIAARHDLNNDGKADIYWHNKRTGQSFVYLMNGTQVLQTGSPSTRADTQWQVVGRGDFNGDGKEDILWRHQETGVNEIDLMSGVSLTSTLSLNTIPKEWYVIGAGDINGDNTDDIVWQNSSTGMIYAYQMLSGSIDTSAQLGVASINFQVKGLGDFNADGKADLWLRNNETGENKVLILNGLTIEQESSLGVISLDWQLLDITDVDGDGDGDVLWRNKETDTGYLYIMQDGALQSGLSMPTKAQQWRLAMIGDLNGDLSHDLIWYKQNTEEVVVDFMDASQSGTISSSQALSAFNDSNWQIVPIKAGSEIKATRYDFDGDNKADVLLHNLTTGQSRLNSMNGIEVSASKNINQIPVTWKVAGRGDFDGDGKTDILWRNGDTGQNYIYLMDGAIIVGQGMVNIIATHWKVKAVADFNGDGKADILWRNQSTGTTWLYTMNGYEISDSKNVSTISDMNWQVAATPDTNGDG
ncbi:FG-GAP-like repeat-containing protein, partial [Litorilituus lipolyticus]|uniref:FG-GAP-like repeat-containing protein n=1 Tax=Litorilituus lipolyticus TaxID=2491017 RepID=UPI001BADA1ED